MKMAVIDSSPSRRLRVAVLNRNFATTAGGAERYSVAVVEQLAESHDMHVFSQTCNHAWPGVTYHRIAHGFDRPRWLNQLWFAVATWWATRIGFDIVHSHENVWHGNVHTMHVKTVQGSLLGEKKGWLLLLRWLKIATSLRHISYLSFERARLAPHPRHAVVAASQTLANELMHEYPLITSNLRIITPGVEIPTKIAPKKEAAYAVFAWPAAKNILFIANDYTRKGLPALLQALQGLPSDVRLRVVGHTRQIAQYRAQAQELGLDGRVEFLGSITDTHPVFCAADALAHPTLEDSFGMVVLEAFAYGLPVMVSRAPFCGIAALLEDKKHAWILEDPQNSEDVRLALHSILNDSQLAENLASHAKQFAQAHSWKKTGAAYAAIYQSVAKNTSRSIA